MQQTDFIADSSGRVIKTPQGYWAFIPNPLPPPIELSWELVRENSAADRALGEPAGVARTLPNPHLLISPFIRREAVLSSRIEGTQASLSDLLFFEASGETEPQPPDVREVFNYVKALEYGLKRLTELPVSLRLIREMHQLLLEGVRGEQMEPGDFRQKQNWIGPPGSRLEEAIFVPPPLPEMTEALDHLEKYLHNPSALPPLMRLAFVHYQFEAIHPFLDGNGRIGRLLLTLLLCAEGLLPQPLLYLSAYFEQNRQQYYDLLLAVTQRGAWKEWLSFFLGGVAEQAQDAIRRSKRLMDLWRQYRQRLQSARTSALSLRLVDELFSYPAITIPQAAKRLQVTYGSAKLNIEKLARYGILRQATMRRRNRVFIAPEIVQIIEAPKAD